MQNFNLQFNFKDLLLSPRIAFSPKKIWIFLLGNLAGYIFYWIISYLSIMLSGIDINDAIDQYGLFPCLFGNEAPMISWLFYYCGIINWLFFVMLSNTAVSRVTYNELKGDSFFSINEEQARHLHSRHRQ